MARRKKTITFELFPTRTPEGHAKQLDVCRRLNAFSPLFFSCTSGAGGSTRSGTMQTVRDILSEQIAAAPHLPCIGMQPEEIKVLLDEYKALGVRHIIALRGDIPSGTGFGMDGLRYANELVELIRREYGDHFHIEVAAYPEFHPQAHNAAEDLDNFVRKAKAGANAAITQYFFNPDSYLNFVDEVHKRGADIPIIPGIMPIESFTKLARFSDLCGAEIPRWIRWKMHAYADDTESIRAFALDIVTRLCERVLEGGAPGLHFYTMNRAELSSEICRRLGYPHSV